jgi:hypothetical protein
MNIRDQIKAAEDRPEEIIQIPEWDITLRVRGMSALDAAALAADDGSDLYAQRLLCRCVCDDDGKMIYPTAADAAELMAKSLPIVRRLLGAANRVNGLDSGLQEGETVKKD